MPAGCLEKNCRDCEWHVTKDMKLDCNYGNRLGLSQPVLGAFASKETDKEVLKRKLEAKKNELKEMEEAVKEGEESANLP
jgi:hypothetical protein